MPSPAIVIGHRARTGVLGVLLLALVASAGAAAAATFTVPDEDLPVPLVMVAYGDTRFTDTRETVASQPQVRQALIARIAALHPAAVFLNGDLPWHGNPGDYAVYRDETSVWRDAHLRIYPALGNHEFATCDEPQCLEYWWDTFPELRSRRWYSVALGQKIMAIMLDSNASLLPNTEQRSWLEQQIAGMSRKVRGVLIVLHHPPVADIQTGDLADHNPRPNESSLADYLDEVAPRSHARFFVSAGHTHNYERFRRHGVVYLVSGGGGAHPYPVERGPHDLYRSPEFPNYHYVRLELRAGALVAEMFRLADYAAAAPAAWELKDRFELKLRP
ncbi:MAG: metallophosphoesterase family protein [Steroidobacterales bacterium]